MQPNHSGSHVESTESATDANSSGSAADPATPPLPIEPQSRRDSRTSGGSSATADPAQSLISLQHECLRNALYHSARSAYYDLVNRWFNFSIILLGLGAAVDFINIFNFNSVALIKFMALTAGILAALQLTFDLGSKSKDHDFLRRRCFQLYANLQSAEATAEDVKKELFLLFADEPVPTYRGLDAVAYNQASERLDREGLLVPWYCKVFKNIIPFHSLYFKDSSKRA